MTRKTRPARPAGSRTPADLRVSDPDLAFALRSAIPGLRGTDQAGAWALVHAMDGAGAWTLSQYRMARTLLARGRGAAVARS